MTPMAPLACAALFWGTSAFTFQVQSEQSSRLMREDCHTAVAGDDCYANVQWAMRKGFLQHPEWYPTLTSASTFEDFQAFLHSRDNATHACGKPCEAQKKEQLTAETCRTSVQGEDCFNQVKWAMQQGFVEHPEWYPTLTRESTFEDFQTLLHDRKPQVCTMPCLARQQDKREERATASEEEATKQSEKPAAEPPQMPDPVPPPAPQGPREKGCYVWKPDGCPRQSQPADGSGWKLDLTKTHEAAATTWAACMARKAPFDKYCGTTSTKMLWIPPEPEVPSEKGCYMWKPTGCPRQNQPADGSGWNLEISRIHEEPTTLEMTCMAKKEPYDKYCGTTDIRMLYVK